MITEDDFETADVLTSPKAISIYLQDSLEDDDPRSFVYALGDVCRASGGSAVVAQKANIPISELDRMLTGEIPVSVEAFWKLAAAFGIKTIFVSRNYEALAA